MGHLTVFGARRIKKTSLRSEKENKNHLLQQPTFPSFFFFFSFLMVFLLLICGFFQPVVVSLLLHLLPLVASQLHCNCFWDPRTLKTLEEREGDATLSMDVVRPPCLIGCSVQDCSSVRPSADLSFGEFKPPDGAIGPRHELKPKCQSAGGGFDIKCFS